MCLTPLFASFHIPTNLNWNYPRYRSAKNEEGTIVKKVILTITGIAVVLVMSCAVRAQDSTLTPQEQTNLAKMLWIYENGVNAHNPSAWDSILTEDYVRHCEAMPPELQTITGKEAMKEMLAEIFAALPDWHEEIQQIVVQGDRIALMTRGTGTLTGRFGAMEPTGKSAVTTTIMIHRFVDGKVAESWVTWDNLYFMQQLGLFPPQGAETPSTEAHDKH